MLSGLLLGVVQIPAENVYGRILPALGIALPLGTTLAIRSPNGLGSSPGPYAARIKIEGLIRSDRDRVEALERLGRATLILTVFAVTGWGGMWTVLPMIFLVLSSYSFSQYNTMAGALSGLLVLPFSKALRPSGVAMTGTARCSSSSATSRGTTSTT